MCRLRARACGSAEARRAAHSTAHAVRSLSQCGQCACAPACAPACAIPWGCALGSGKLPLLCVLHPPRRVEAHLRPSLRGAPPGRVHAYLSDRLGQRGSLVDPGRARSGERRKGGHLGQDGNDRRHRRRELFQGIRALARRPACAAPKWPPPAAVPTGAVRSWCPSALRLIPIPERIHGRVGIRQRDGGEANGERDVRRKVPPPLAA